MPEGPEIHRAADEIADVLVGYPAGRVRFGLEELEQHEETLEGRQVRRVEARGKAILTRFEGGWNIYSHNQLYGKWMTRKAGDLPDTNRQLRVEITNDYQSAYLFSASEIEVLRDDELADQSYLAKLGPDPLIRETDEADIVERFEETDFHRRQLATLLLDQGFVAGLGNYLRSEILWSEEVHPREKLGGMDEQERRGLAETTWRLTRRAYEMDSATIDDEMAAERAGGDEGEHDVRYYAYGRKGADCPRCGDTIVREEHGGRRVFLCPSCQPAP
jgi:endonuclease-8